MQNRRTVPAAIENNIHTGTHEPGVYDAVWRLMRW